MKGKKKIGQYLIAPVFIVLVYGIIYFVREIYPFGDGNISYYDMAQSFVPIYEHCYDVLHGNKSIWFDWFSGAGEGMVGLVGWSVLNPINWILFFVPEGKILQFMSAFVLIKLVLCAITMQYYLEQKFKSDVNPMWKILFAFIYANSGYVLQFYTNVYFLDAVWMFPLIIYALEKMLKKKKMAAYTILLALSLTFNLYFSFMILIYILFSSFGQIFFCMDKQERGSRAIVLGISTVVALGLSAWMWVPCAWQMLNSPRMQNETGYADIISQTDNLLVAQKEWHLFGTEIALAIILVGGVRFFFRNRQRAKYCLFMLVLMLVPIWIEGVDLLWHTGSYVMFPMRFGFMTVFTVLTVAMHIIKEDCFKIRCPKEFIALMVYIFVPAVGIMLGYVFFEYMKGFREFGIPDMHNYDLTTFFICMYIICYIVWCVYYEKFQRQIKAVTLGVVIGIQLVIGIYALMAPEKLYSIETGEYFVEETNELREAWAEELHNNNLSRIKCADVSLNVNYPLLLKYPAVSGWTNAANTNIQGEMMGMGYSYWSSSRLFDAGGTIFTDALLGYDKAFAKTELDGRLYSGIADYEEYHLYERKYVFPQGILVGEKFANLEYDSEKYRNCYEYQNEIFRQLIGIDKELIRIVELGEPIIIEEGIDLSEDYQGYNRFTYSIPSDRETVVYLHLDREQLKEHVIIETEEGLKEFRFLTLTSPTLPFYGNNNSIEVMTARGDMELKLCTKADELKGAYVGILDVELLREYINAGVKAVEGVQAGDRSLDFSVEAEQAGYVFLPIGYDAGWNCLRNGEKVAIENCFGGAFILVPIEQGENEVHMKYFPKGMKEGICISILFLIIFSFYKKIVIIMSKSKIINTIFAGIFMMISLMGLFIIYIVPAASWIVQKIS